MRLEVDRQSDTLRLRLDESAIVESREVQPGVILNFNAHGKLIGVDLLKVSSQVTPDSLRSLRVETGQGQGHQVSLSWDEDNHQTSHVHHSSSVVQSRSHKR